MLGVCQKKGLTDAEKPRWWRESKVSMVATFCRESFDVDPMPDVPDDIHSLVGNGTR